MLVLIKSLSLSLSLSHFRFVLFVENTFSCSDGGMEFMSSEEFDEHRNINDHACMHASASNSCRKYNNILMIPGNE